MSTSAIGALERGSRRAPYRDTVALLATALGLAAHEHAELEAVASQARGRQPRIDAEPQTRHNLPIRLTSFLGRDAEIAEIEALLRTCRLVTITGSGGVGKTRTATEVAKRLLGEQQEEAWFIDLSTIDDGALVAGTIAAVLDVALAPDADSSRSIAAKLKARKLLLILDNCEHVIDEAAVVVAAIVSRHSWCPPGIRRRPPRPARMHRSNFSWNERPHLNRLSLSTQNGLERAPRSVAGLRASHWRSS